MIDVAMTRAEVRACDVAVVIDVLRATTTIVEALAAGYESVVCVAELERALALREPGRVLAGERHCVAPDGFDQGNSPGEAQRVRGRELVLATTNGAPTIVAAAARARRVLVASLSNLAAVADILREVSPATVELQIVCSGSDGLIALEDVYAAGRLSARLPGPRSDAALVAEAVGRGFATPGRALEASLGAARLRAAGLGDDIELCARESVLGIVPEVTAWQAGQATTRAPHPAGVDRVDTVGA
jgi:2-phosphosulfolactate phosphatase